VLDEKTGYGGTLVIRFSGFYQAEGGVTGEPWFSVLLPALYEL